MSLRVKRSNLIKINTFFTQGVATLRSQSKEIATPFGLAMTM